MKIRFVMVLLTMLYSISCSTDQTMQPVLAEEVTTEFGENEWPQKWQLVEMSGNMSNVPPQTGDEMDYQEWYVLRENGTFTKTRTRENAIKQTEGTYSIKAYGHGKFIEFTFQSENSLLGNCDSTLSESLHISAENELRGTWLICDGPGLTYKRVRYEGDEENKKGQP